MYNLELSKVRKRIIDEKASLVCIQLPDGLKPRAKEIVDYLEAEAGADIVVWFSSCFGACDIPHIKEADLLVQFGHSEWKDA